MFDSVRLKNFRAYRDTGRVRLRPLTLIVGPNNAGKSTLLKAILLLKQTIDGQAVNEPLVTSGPYTDLGSFEDILRGGADAGARSVSIALSQPRDLFDQLAGNFMSQSRDDLIGRVGNELRVDFGFDPEEKRVRLLAARLSRDGRRTVETKYESGHHTTSGLPRGQEERFELYLRHFLPFLLMPELPEEPRQMVEILQTSIASTAESQTWANAISAVDHTAPIRESVPRLTVLGRVTPTQVGAGGETLLRLLRTAEASREEPSRALIEAVDYWVSKRFNLLGRLRLEEVDRAGRILQLLADERGGFKDINVANMGEGISQLLPIVADVLMLPANGCLLVEQPELHLHPAAQASLGDIFVDSVSGAAGPQFIVETHSEHLLLRIRRRIAQGRLSPQDVSVLFVDKPRKEAKVRELELDASGMFEEWPEGFFEEGYLEALKLAEAARADE